MFDNALYEKEIAELFGRFPSVQNVPFSKAYKPGLERMREFDELLGHPCGKFKSIHVAGTNGKGSVSNMLASALTASGYKTGLYTSPHILDFRERMRIGRGLIPKEYVLDFILRWRETFERLSLSFFEITTGLAFRWFADSGVDVAVIEVGLGGRLDSTNIITPELSIVTCIGLDHCDLLGHTLAEIAREKAGIFKASVPALVGQADGNTRPVFMESSRGGRLVFAEDCEPPLWERSEELLAGMDLQGCYQKYNLRTALAAINMLKDSFIRLQNENTILDALAHTASIMDFHGRWEKLSDRPRVLCDIGHNAHALRNNFAQLEALMAGGCYSSLTIIYAVMADKDLDSIIPLMPLGARYVFVTPRTSRALPAEKILERVAAYRKDNAEGLRACDSVAQAVKMVLSEAEPTDLIYIGGSTFAVAEALPLFGKDTSV